MSSPVSTSTITATTLLTLMCVDASVSKNQSEYAHVLGSAWLFFSSGPNRVAHSRRTSMSICSRSNRLPSALSANSGSGDLQYWRPSLYEFSRCFCIIFCFMLSNLAVGDLQALAKMPRLALQLGEVLEHLVGGGLVNMAVVVGDKFDELLHRVELRARHGGAFRQGCRQPPRRFRGDEVEYGGDIMQIRGVEQGLAEATGHHYRGMLAVGGRQVFG